MSASVLQQAQKLDPDPIVELWELDTTSLTTIHGVPGQGTVYTWTPGILNYREEGNLSAGSTATVLVLDRHIIVANNAQSYTVQVANNLADQTAFLSPVPVTSWGTTVVGGNTVSTVGLGFTLPGAPAAGCAYLIESVGKPSFGGVVYTPAPIQVTNLEWSGQGKLPKPILKVSNIGGLAAALVIEFGDIVGATVTRKLTFKTFLDGEATPDPSAYFEPEVFLVDRKSSHTRQSIEFELAAHMDQQGISLPKRLVLRDACDQTYRQWNGTQFVYGSCPYVGTALFRSDGSPAANPLDDICGKRVHDCTLRFGQFARLPFRGFPGAAEVSVSQ